MNATPENSQQTDNGIYELIASQFSWAPLSVLYQFLESLDTQEYRSMLTALIEKANLNDKVNQQVQAWEQERVNPGRTRLVVKLINHTDLDFEIGEHNLQLNADEQHLTPIFPWDIQALKFDLAYTRRLGSRNKDMFKHFIVFGDKEFGFRFDFGLRVNTSFGVISPTLTPVRTHTLTSIGTSPIQCTTRITRTASEEPYGFTVELTLS
ncbi:MULTISPECIES: hypothetical protein [Pseudomonas]|jgi:hypothetical protein|uniref:Uncharacterized protein n=1 Tax=Pseudomonas bijieensis TaxID=2681983 RepID=A0A6N1CC07_9PSED|nr:MULTISPECIES: hypothetical protein [Pseudomonas]PWJ30587.1 hypothetical protein ATJ40_116169 [Pseudomonas sp. 43mfcvi1.1]QKS82534.1 hypothetical protein GN234_11485 [Pseudomonas bijieensis]SSB99264.1 hypothetical protein SAMN04488697_116169 [Pseudomonas sp. 43mfcvi1.1]